MIEGCAFGSWSEITEEVVAEYLCAMGDEGFAELTVRGYAQAARQFTAWMSRKRRAGADPLAGLDPKDYGSQVTEARRPLTIEELRWLIAIAATAPTMKVRSEAGGVTWSMTGTERSLLYRLAAETGLRASELRSLTRGSFDLDADTPVVRLPGDATKNRQPAEIPLRPATVDLLAKQLEGRGKAAAALNVPPSYDTARMIRTDLRLSRGRWIKATSDRKERRERRRSDFLRIRTDAGVLTFHSLRHTCGSLLAAAGVHPKVAQTLMRHSDIKLTMNLYTHSYREDEARAIAKLPDLSPTEQRPALLRATGTTPATADPEKTQRKTQRASRPDRHCVSSADTRKMGKRGDGYVPAALPLTPRRAGSSREREKATRGIRTRDLCFTKAPL
jgi:integrase